MTEHIGIFVPHLGIGGVQRSMLRTATELARRGHRVDLVLNASRGALVDLVPPEVRVVDLRSRVMATAIRPLSSYLKRERPAVLLSSVCNANVAALIARRLARSDTRLVIREASAPHAQRRLLSDNRRLERVYRLIPYVYPWADRIIAVSAGVAEELTRFFGIDPDAIDVVWNPVVSEEISGSASAPPGHPWLGEGEPPVILGVGRFARQKDFATLVSAFAILCRTDAARLVLIGDGPLRSELEQQVTRSGLRERVEMPGFVVNPYAWMGRAAALAVTSLWEGFGNTIAEALACGTEVVATDCPHGPAEILDGGRYGRLVPTRDPARTAQALSDVLRAEPRREVLLGRAREFSVERAADRYEEILLGGRTARMRAAR